MKFPATFVVATLISAASAQAQLKLEAETGSRIPKAPDEFPIDRAREVVERFAECGVKKFPQLAHEMVLDASKVTVGDRYMKIADPDCLVQATTGSYAAVHLRLDPQSFRSAAADVLEKRNLVTFNPITIKSASALSKPTLDPADYVRKPGSKARWKQEDYDEAKVRDAALVWLAGFGECAVRTNPIGARALLGTKVNSDGELQALRSMIPAFSACLDEGRQLKTERAALRGTVALNYYRLAYAPKVHRPEEAK